MVTMVQKPFLLCGRSRFYSVAEAVPTLWQKPFLLCGGSRFYCEAEAVSTMWQKPFLLCGRSCFYSVAEALLTVWQKLSLKVSAAYPQCWRKICSLSPVQLLPLECAEPTCIGGGEVLPGSVGFRHGCIGGRDLCIELLLQGVQAAQIQGR